MNANDKVTPLIGKIVYYAGIFLEGSRYGIVTRPDISEGSFIWFRWYSFNTKTEQSSRINDITDVTDLVIEVDGWLK